MFFSDLFQATLPTVQTLQFVLKSWTILLRKWLLTKRNFKNDRSMLTTWGGAGNFWLGSKVKG